MTESNAPLNDRVDPNASTEQNPATDAPEYRNDGSDYMQDNTDRRTDRMETLESASTPLATLPDSPTSESDAGIDDAQMDREAGSARAARDLAGLAGQPLDDELTNELEDSDLTEGLPDTPNEIPMSDLADPLNPEMDVQAPEMSDLNVPGEVDIEELDEDALSDTDIPRDALLDPLED